MRLFLTWFHYNVTGSVKRFAIEKKWKKIWYMNIDTVSKMQHLQTFLKSKKNKER